MKSLKKLSLITGLFALLLTGCSKLKDFGDINVDPNRTTVPNTSALLTNVLAGISGRATQQVPGYFAQYFSETQYPGNSLYAIPKFEFDGLYAGAMFDLQNIINNNTDPKLAALASVNGSNNNQIAIARILKAYYFWTITDAWGDIPYTEALTISNKFPKYDRQEVVYKGIISEWKEAIDQFDNGPTVKGDIVFNGDVVKWKKLANSLRMLAAMRLTKRFPGAGEYAALEFKAALADPNGSIETNADNFSVKYPGGSFQSPWFAEYNSRKDLGEALPFVNLLINLGDKRQLNNIYGSSQIGVPFGRDRQYMNNIWGNIFAADQWSRVLGPGFRGDNGSVAIVHASAVLFARAEAAERGWTTENAKSFYESAVTTSYTQWGLTTADASGYLAGSGVAYGADNLTKISLQRYIALYPDGLQGWSEWRRTNVPTLTPAPDASNSSKLIPRRYVYGTNDYSTNKDNVAEAVALLDKGDSQDSRVWWDK